jgi:2-amino-4-hydroxy-6-hydroxymethyldihydropteridine diphosphokinase
VDAADGVQVLDRSSVYETEPVGEFTEQPDFYNAALKVETELAPHALLDVCKRVEKELGREPGGRRHGPRSIDVDLLLAGDLELRNERLILPHPEIANRRFVLVPLLELDTGLTLPGGRALADALDDLGDTQSVTRVGELGGS